MNMITYSIFINSFFQQLKDRYGELQKSQQLTVKEQNDLAHQLEDVKARKVKYNLILIYMHIYLSDCN